MFSRMATTLQHVCVSTFSTSAVQSPKAEHVEKDRVRFFGDSGRLRMGSTRMANLASAFAPYGDRMKRPSVPKKTTLHELYEKQGQSPWYDNLSRPVADLQISIDSGVRGVTSNPTIFERAITSSNLYDDQFRQLMKEGNGVEEVFWGLAVTDIQDACDLFLPLYEESKGGDGFISLEVSTRTCARRRCAN